jgi:hypothetical protein
VLGLPKLADPFPRVDASVVAERGRRRRQAQRDFDPEELTAEERLDRKLADLKSAARALLGRDTGERERRAQPKSSSSASVGA